MSYRMLVSAGVVVGMTATTAMAQLPGQQPDRMRPGAQQVKQLLQDLEGSWDVEVRAWTIADARRGMGDGQPTRPGATGQVDTQRIQQQIQQAMTQAGVDMDEARTHAQRLAQQFAQQRPQRQQIQQQLQSAMTQAGVDMQQARQQAERLAGQIQQQLQQQDQPGVRPERDETPSPFTRPGQQRDHDREYGEPTLRAEGTSNRQWVLDENILQEEVDFQMATEAPADRPGQAGQFQRGLDRAVQLLRDGETLEGQGMFGLDEDTGHIYHVWADSSQGKIFYSVGEYDAQQRSVTFLTADAREIMNGIGTPREPGIRPGQPRPQDPARPGQPQRPGTTPGGEPDASLMSNQQPGQQPDWRRDRPGQQPGVSRPDMHQDRARVVLRIINDDEHVVEYYRTDNGLSPGARQQALRTMVVTYTRNNNN